MVQRVTYRRQNAYNTRSNRIKAVRTPGGRLVAHYLTKKVAPAQTEWLNGERIGGLPRLGGNNQRRLSKSQRRVNRPYGGVITASALKDK